MLEASRDGLTLSITIPLVPPASDTVWAGAPGIVLVMSKLITQPPDGHKVGPLPAEIPTKSLSVVPFFNSVSGEHSPLALFEICSAPGSGEVLSVVPEKPMRYNVGC